jgi:hypothetical protein
MVAFGVARRPAGGRHGVAEPHTLLWTRRRRRPVRRLVYVRGADVDHGRKDLGHPWAVGRPDLHRSVHAGHGHLGTGVAHRRPARPSPVDTAHQPRPPWVGAPLPPTGSASASASVGGSPKGFRVWLALALLGLVAAAAASLARLRHRRSPAGAATMPVDEGRNPSGRVSPDPPTASPMHTPPPSGHDTRSVPAASPPSKFAPPPLGDLGTLVVRVLGPVEVTGWAVAPAERRTVVESLCCYLALHAERARAIEELLVALDPIGDARRDRSAKTLRNNLSRLRQAVGLTRMPDAVSSGGYRLTGAVTDWGRFTELVEKAGADGAEVSEALLAEALSHVRGVPFEGVPHDPYAWAIDGALVHEMTTAVCQAAHTLSERRLAAGDHVGAMAAARLGQRGSRDDVRLWTDLFAAARAARDPGALRRLETEAARVLGPELTRSLRADHS